MAYTSHVYFGEYFEVPTSKGLEIVPLSETTRTMAVAAQALENYVIGDLVDPDAVLEVKAGWLGRLVDQESLQTTAYCVYDTKREAYIELEGQTPRDRPKP